MAQHILPGRISICRRSDGLIILQVDDESSGCRAFEAQMTPEAFGNAVTGLSNQPATCTWFDAPLGKRHEHKTVAIPLGDDYRFAVGDRQAAIAAMKTHETDGWLGSEDDLFNPHRHSRDRFANRIAKVSFHRYVDPEVA